MLAKFYGVSMNYLFGLAENRKHPNAALSELHLSDEMVELLKTGRVNNRLMYKKLGGEQGYFEHLFRISYRDSENHIHGDRHEKGVSFFQ